MGNVEDCRLVFAERAHHLKAFDCRIGGLQPLEASDRADQLLQLAVIGLDNVVETLHLPMLRVLRTLPARSTGCGVRWTRTASCSTFSCRAGGTNGPPNAYSESC